MTTRPEAGDDHGTPAVVVAVSDRGRLEDFVQPFGGRVHCHAPLDRPFSFAALARPDDGRERWGSAGRRTVHLAGDPAIALAEYARHREPNAADDSRCLVSFRLQVVTVLDLRRPAVLAAVGLRPGLQQFLDRDLARRVSRAVRDADVCQGLIVPSVAFLDRPERFNVVLFIERLGVDLESILTDRETVGELRVAGR
jgi:RES domain-containing protein